jgi:hypothetical protein
MFGYDAARLHAAVNDAAPVLLPLAVLFDLLGTFLKRDSSWAAGSPSSRACSPRTPHRTARRRKP